MLIGYIIYGNDNDSYMFDDADDLPTCSQCGYITDFNYINSKFRVKRRVYDFSYTYDGRCIVSLKFKEFCNRHKYKGIEFLNLPNDKEYFSFIVKNIVQYDLQKSGIKFEEYCNKCEKYVSIVCEGEVFIKNIRDPLKDGFYSSDFHFGSGNEKSPDILIGVETYSKIKMEKFTGITFEKIETED